MPSAEIISYTAHTGYLGRLGTEKFIVVQHRMASAESGAEPVEATSEIYFADRFGESDREFTTMGSATSVRGHLPASEYVHWIDLMRHEDPVYLHWSATGDTDTQDPDGLLHLSTGPEPPGEGPIDLSP